MAVYTPLEDDEIREFLTQYDLGSLEKAEGIAAGVENTNYKLLIRGSHGIAFYYILTLFEKRVSPEDLPFFVEVMQAFSSSGLAVPQPIPQRSGEVIAMLKDKHALMVSFLEGESTHVLTPHHLSLLGGVMAKMHSASALISRVRPNALSLPGWQTLHGMLGSRLDSMTSGLATLIGKELAFQESVFPRHLPRGLIHADLFPDNIFYATIGGRLHLTGVIDFYFACTDFYAYDLAIALNACCFNQDWQFSRPHAAALFNAYEAGRTLTPEEKSAFPVFARGAALRFLLTRAYDALHTPEDAVVSVKDPKEYLAKLLFHQGIKDFEEYR